ncbi:MAG: hypothetical protein ACK56F_07985, partial [bacterium]
PETITRKMGCPVRTPHPVLDTQSSASLRLRVSDEQFTPLAAATDRQLRRATPGFDAGSLAAMVNRSFCAVALRMISMARRSWLSSLRLRRRTRVSPKAILATRSSMKRSTSLAPASHTALSIFTVSACRRRYTSSRHAGSIAKSGFTFPF